MAELYPKSYIEIHQRHLVWEVSCVVNAYF